MDNNGGIGRDIIGLFTGICTVTSNTDNNMLCKYEIYLYTQGIYNVAGILVNTPIEGTESTGVVTGSEYDFEEYDGGILRTLQDPQLPILYAYLSMQ